jgi:hypothetical protein
MQNSPDFGNDLRQHPDLFLAPQLQNLSYLFVMVQNQELFMNKEFSFHPSTNKHFVDQICMYLSGIT